MLATWAAHSWLNTASTHWSLVTPCTISRWLSRLHWLPNRPQSRAFANECHRGWQTTIWAESQHYILANTRGIFGLWASFQYSQLSFQALSHFILGQRCTWICFDSVMCERLQRVNAVCQRCCLSYQQHPTHSMEKKHTHTQEQLCKAGLAAHRTAKPMLAMWNERTTKPAKRAVFVHGRDGVLLWQPGYLPTNITQPSCIFV